MQEALHEIPQGIEFQDVSSIHLQLRLWSCNGDHLGLPNGAQRLLAKAEILMLRLADDALDARIAIEHQARGKASSIIALGGATQRTCQTDSFRVVGVDVFTNLEVHELVIQLGVFGATATGVVHRLHYSAFFEVNQLFFTEKDDGGNVC